LQGAVAWLTGREAAPPPAKLVEEDLRVVHTKQQDLVWFYASVLGLPAALFALGWLWSRRSAKPRGGP
jgi:hypothetical protein